MRYLGTRGVHLFMQSRFNGGVPPAFNLPTFFNASEVPSRASLRNLPSQQDFLDARQRLLEPLGFLSSFTAFPAQGNSIYHGGSVNIRRRLSGGFSVDGSYTWSRTIDDSTNELFTSSVNPRRAQDFFDRRNDRAESVLSRPHRLAIGWIWEVPFYKNARGFLGQALGNWQISGVYQAESGQPYDALSFNDANGNFDAAGDRRSSTPRGPWPGHGRKLADQKRPDRRAGFGRPERSRRLRRRRPERGVRLCGHGRSRQRRTQPSSRAGAEQLGPRAVQAIPDHRKSPPGIPRRDVQRVQPPSVRHRRSVRARFVNVRSADFQNKRLFSGNPYGTIPTFGLITNPLASGNPRVIQMVLRYSF